MADSLPSSDQPLTEVEHVKVSSWYLRGTIAESVADRRTGAAAKPMHWPGMERKWVTRKPMVNAAITDWPRLLIRTLNTAKPTVLLLMLTPAGTPMLRICRSKVALGFRSRKESFKPDRPLTSSAKQPAAARNCEITLAAAAPATPMSSQKMNTGSSTTLSKLAPPMT